MNNPDELVCPSVPPEAAGAVVFGVIGGPANRPMVRYLQRGLPMTDEIIQMVAPAQVPEVLRLAGRCAAEACAHFDGARCSLAQRVVSELPEVVDSLPPCSQRSHCRWWTEQGKDACFRCPQVVSLCVQPTAAFIAAALPTAS